MQNKPKKQKDNAIDNPGFWIFMWMILVCILNNFYHHPNKLVGALIVIGIPVLIIYIFTGK